MRLLGSEVRGEIVPGSETESEIVPVVKQGVRLYRVVK